MNFLSEELDFSCDVETWHREDDLELTANCWAEAGGEVAGTIDMDSGLFALEGTLRGEQAEVVGAASADATLIASVWTLEDGSVGGLSGRIEARRGGVLAVDCDGRVPGIQSTCSYDAGERFLAQIHILELPPDGYDSFQIAFGWTWPILAYRKAATRDEELLETECGIGERGTGSILPLPGYICLNEPEDEVRLSTGTPIQAMLSCWSEGTTELSAGDERSTLLWEGGLSRTRFPATIPDISNATVSCSASDGPLGDIDCDGLLNSRDAMILLQVEAALLEPPACDYQGDTTQDGFLTSWDAAVILVTVAGFVI